MTTWTWLWAAMALGRPECDANGGDGCLELADIADQLGRERKARRLRERACTPRTPHACEARWRSDRETTNGILDEAATTCAEGAEEVCRRLAAWHLDGPVGVRDRRKAHQLLEGPCDRGNGWACLDLAWSLDASGPDRWRNVDRARSSFGRACETGIGQACREHAEWSIIGLGGALSVDEAYASLERACSLREPDACLELAQWLTDGRGRDPDAAAAVRAWAATSEQEPDLGAEIVEAVKRAGLDPSGLRAPLNAGCQDDFSEACGGLSMLGEPLPEGADLEAARGFACRHGQIEACDALAVDAPPDLQRRLALHATVLKRRIGGSPWVLADDGPEPWLPDVEQLRTCVEPHVKRYSAPTFGGRPAGSMGYDHAAELVGREFQKLGLEVRTTPVPLPLREPTGRQSPIRLDGKMYGGFAVPGSASGGFEGKARVLDGPPTRDDLEDLDDVAVVLFAAPRFEPAAARRYLRAPVPVIAVPPELARRVGDREVGGYAWTEVSRHDDNVLGVLPGRGTLADQTIVLGAHLDGQDSPEGRGTHPSADDNASGVAGVLCAAAALIEHLADVKNHRTVIFAAFAAEEAGLYGSRSFVWTERPSPDAMVNLDMIGRLGERPVELRAYGSQWSKTLGPIARAHDIEFVRGDDEGLSDHAPFGLAGVPAIHLHSGLHGDYHRETDVFERVDLDGTAKVTSVAASTIARLAAGPSHRPARDPCTELTDETLGLGWDLDTFVSDRFKVRCVREGSLAEALHVQPGDRMMSMDLDEWPLRPPRVVVERRGGCFALELGDSGTSISLNEVPQNVPCESAP